MKGKITKINPRKGFAAILTENKDYTVIEMLGNYYLELGDIIKGNPESLGRESLYNISQDEEIDVFIQEVYASKKIMESLINR